MWSSRLPYLVVGFEITGVYSEAILKTLLWGESKMFSLKSPLSMIELDMESLFKSYCNLLLNSYFFTVCGLYKIHTVRSRVGSDIATCSKCSIFTCNR